MRLRSDFWVGALTRRAEAAGAYVSIARKGAAEAGAIFICVDRRDGGFDLYGPAPQSALAAGEVADRLFWRIADAQPENRIRARMDSETRFDSDLWLIDVEDRQGRPFVEIAKSA